MEGWVSARWSVAVSDIVAGTTSRYGGVSQGEFESLNLRQGIGDSDERVAENQRRLAAWLDPEHAGQRSLEIQWLDQVHGNDVVYVDGNPEVGQQPKADAAWTDQPGVALAIRTADCLPVLLREVDGPFIGAAHAGWRGLLNDVVGCLVREMDIAPERLEAWIGPALGSCCFEVGQDVWGPMQASFPDAVQAHGRDVEKRMVDMRRAMIVRLQQLGIGSVKASTLCTLHAQSLYSHRQATLQGGSQAMTGRMASVILRCG